MILFRRKVPCDSCGVPFPKRELSVLDGTFRGDHEEREKQSLCRDCLKSRMTKYFQAFRWKAAAVHPTAGRNAYHFYAFEQMSKFNIRAELIEQLQKLLPAEGSACERCGASARFSWIPASIYGGGPPLDRIVDLPPVERQELLCERCMGIAFCSKVDELNLAFAEVLPPLGGSGFLTPRNV